MITPMGLFLFLAVSFQVKHFVVDYLLQNKYMLGKFNKEGWLKPLLAHTSMHGVATLIIAMAFGLPFIPSLGIALTDMFVHTCIDRWKVNASAKYTTSDKQFWWLLGTDQMLHHFTHYFLILVIISKLMGL
jgi:hypothetical protein